MPVLCQRPQKDRDDVRPTPRFGYWLEAELTIEDMQIALRGNDEHAIGLDVQALGDECDWHLRVMGEDFVQQGFDRSEMVNDDNSYAEIGWKIP